MAVFGRSQRVWAHRGAVLLLGVSVLLAACGQSASVAAAQGTLTGDVEASPTCPVEQVGKPCPPAPVPNREVQVLDASGKVAASTKTDVRGHFSLAIAAGEYVVKVAIVSGQIGMRQTTPGNVTITAGQTATITIVLDTGIR
jgi:hypothetical protein